MSLPLPLRLRIGDALWRLVLKPYLFRQEPERAHVLTIKLLKALQKFKMLWLLRFFYRSPYVKNTIWVGGEAWRNPVGLAAGFDKHIEVLPALEALGFGSVELGTIVPEPQFGNFRPRVFRYPEIGAIINRYGFNSIGAEDSAGNLRRIHSRHNIRIPIGISIGKNKRTPDELAVQDYLEVLKHFIGLLRPQDWVQINISSSNTPGLRDIFFRLSDFLGEFTRGAKDIAAKTGAPLPRFILKIPPDELSREQFVDVARAAARYGFVAIEATNTTINKALKEGLGLTEPGGLSGSPLEPFSTAVVAIVSEAVNEFNVDVIGVGGIMYGTDARRKITAGAVAVQILAGLVYRGPVLLHEILEDLKH